MLALAVLFAAACGEPADDRIPGPDQLAETPFEIVGSISVDERGFTPSEITITAGEGIELVNEGVDPHGFDGGEEFGTGLLEPGERSTLVLVEPGDYTYVDPADTGHQGFIVVEPDPDDPDTETEDD